MQLSLDDFENCIPLEVLPSFDQISWVIKPQTILFEKTNYTIKVTKDIRDTFDNPLPNEHFSGFQKITTPCSPTEADSYTLISDLNIPDVQNWDTESQLNDFYTQGPYALPEAIDRVAYCLQVDDDWVWASFTYSDKTKIGVPTDYILDEEITGLNIMSNKLTRQEDINGSVEFWDHCYKPGADNNMGSSSIFDTDDTRSRSDCYGSMQIHTTSETIMAFNSWSSNRCDLQIGSEKNSSGHTDGTFNNNCSQISIKTLKTFVREAP